MNIKNWMLPIIKFFYSLTEKAAWIGYVSVTFITLIVFFDVCGRYLFNAPITGSIELVETVMALLGGAAIMYATVKRVHVALDFLINRFSRHTQIVMQSIFSLLSFGTWLVVAYQVYTYGLSMMKTTQVTAVLRISLTPFLFLLAIAVFLCSLISLIQTFYHIESEETVWEKGGST